MVACCRCLCGCCRRGSCCCLDVPEETQALKYQRKKLLFLFRKKSEEVFPLHFSVFHDLQKQSRADALSGMNRHHRDSAVGMFHDHVTASFPNNFEADRRKRLHDFSCWLRLQAQLDSDLDELETDEFHVLSWSGAFSLKVSGDSFFDSFCQLVERFGLGVAARKLWHRGNVDAVFISLNHDCILQSGSRLILSSRTY